MPCTRAPVIPNGTIVAVPKPAPYQTGDRLSFQCNPGYVSPQSLFVQCQQDGSWEEGRCVPQSCGDPGHVDHAKRKGLDFTYTSSVTYQCHRGYVGSQSKLITYCTGSGRWSPSVSNFTCSLLQCPIPLAVSNGYISYQDRTVDSVVTHICDPGFRMEGKPDRMCLENGQWSGSDPQCIPITCGNPGPYPGGVVEPDQPVYTMHDIVFFRCGSQYVPSKCLGQDKWSIPVPEKPCESTPNVLPDPSSFALPDPSLPLPALPIPPASPEPPAPSGKTGFFSFFQQQVWVRVLVYVLIILLSGLVVLWSGVKEKTPTEDPYYY